MKATWLIVVGLLLAAPAVMAEGELVYWNRLGSPEEIRNSEVGPDGSIVGEPIFLDVMFGGGARTTVASGPLGSRIDLFPDGLLQNADQGTIEFWFCPNFGSSDGNIRHTLNSSADPDGLGIATYWRGWEHLHRSELKFQGETVIQVDVPGSQIPFSAGDVIHHAVVWDLNGIDGSSDTIQVFWNGEKVGSAQQTWAPGRWLCRHLVGLTGYDHGSWIDNFKVWNYAKTDFSDRFQEDAGMPLPFAAFTVDKARVIMPADGPQSIFQFIATAELGAASDGIDLQNEPLTFCRDGALIVVPAGELASVQPGVYQASGSTGDLSWIVTAVEWGGSTYRFGVKGICNGIEVLANPALVTLTVGDDAGQTEVQFAGAAHALPATAAGK